MTDHDAIFAQSREVLMQFQGVPGVYISPAPGCVRTACTVIADAYQVNRKADGPQTVVEERQKIELPRGRGANEVETVEAAGKFEISGVVWGIEFIAPAAPGMHRVELIRRSTVAAVGRRI